MEINISPFHTEVESVAPTYMEYQIVIYMFDMEIYRSDTFRYDPYSLTEFTEAAEATLAELVGERLATKIKPSTDGGPPSVVGF